MKDFLLIIALLGLSSCAFAVCSEAPLPTDPEGPTWSRSIERSGDTAEMVVWRNDCGDGSGDLLITFTPQSGSPFICSTNFDVVQNGRQFDNFRLRSDPNFIDSFCGDLLVESTFFVAQSDFAAQWDTSEEFTLVFRSDQTLDVGAFEPSDAGDGGDREDMPLPEFERNLPSAWFNPVREGDFSIAQLPNHITLPTVVPNGCLSVIPSRFDVPPSQVLVDDSLFIDDLAGDAVPVRIRIWRQGCHEPDRSAILMNIELIDEPSAGLLPIPAVVLRPFGTDEGVRAVPSEFAIQTAAELPFFAGVGLANRALRIGGTEVQSGTTYVIDALQRRLPPEDYNSNLNMTLDFAQGQIFEYDIPSFSSNFDDPQLAAPPLHGRFSGQWVVSDLPSSGLVLQIGEIAPTRNFVFAIWFTYLNGEPIWVVGNADIELGANSLTIDMARLEGGEFFTNPGSFTNEDITSEILGTMTLRAVHCGQIEADIDFRQSGLGQQELTFERLINIAGFTCDQTQ